ncbi:nicotinate-nucleotide adenylyltransferase [Longimicrobium terrae]|uniref:Probable nicotinate-nucleotide adenylyltransferase n=1 Tax=Longimicrobium terrae TaxID=1639882 RepID=A0A841GMM7_9BACT|nr:nicotinate-nucleotide adenylyltransferase [Longimicrobium terrae]MBB6068562.1 nicotinate-nucleotide adenylyltransferase [Longimicrobium terrae]NNC27749.1 nicotinate (nicotinamide) nucleotide adenylyltransferase [Longimicrobium terrae]
MRLGVYGGSFDPPHLGHLVAASDACEALGLSRLLWIPSAVHPLKGDRVRTAPQLRLEMVRAAIAGDERFQADDLELRRAGPSYTVDTLRELRARHPDAELFLLAGADLLHELPRWREPDEVMRLATLAVVSREGDALAPESPLPAVAVRVARVDVSSTEVRRRAAAGQTLRYLVPEPVRALIERHGLYGGRSR